MKRKRIFTLALTMLLIFCSFFSNAYSASNTPINVTIGSVQGTPGQTITVPVSFQGISLSGINNCDFRLEYNSNILEIIDVVPGSIVINPVANFSYYAGKLGSVSLIYNDATQGSSQIKSNGIFANMNFKIKTGAALGSYQIKISNEGSFADKDLFIIPATFNVGTASLISNTENTPTPKPLTQNMNVEIGSVQGSVGQVVAVPVSFKGVPAGGINNCDFRLSYDPNILQVESVVPGSIVTNSSSDFYTYIGSGYITFLFNDGTQGSRQITTDGLFASINFKAKDMVTPGNYQIKLGAAEFADKNLISINSEFNTGAFTVISSNSSSPIKTSTPTLKPTATPTPTPQVKDLNVVIGSAQSSAGQTIAVPVNFQGVPAQGINNCDFKLSYDSNIFEVVSVDPGSIVVKPANNFSANTESAGSILFLYNDATQMSNPITASGLFANINLKIKAGTAAGRYQIKLNSIGSFDNGNLNTINAIFSVGTVTVTASSAMPTPTPTPQIKDMNVVIGSAQGSVGQTIAVPVNFQGVPAQGINNCDFKLSYDSNIFDVVSVDAGSIVVKPANNFSANTESAGSILFLYNDATQMSNPITASGLFANINLKIKAGAAAGRYQIKLNSIGSFDNGNLNTINTIFSVGTVTVTASSAIPTPTPTPTPTSQIKDMNVVIGSAQGSAGQTIAVPVNFQGVPAQGINNCDFKLSYDSNIFEVVSVDAGSIVVKPANNFSANTESAGSILFLYNDATQMSNPITASGLFANINLKIKAGAAAGRYQIKLNSIGSFDNGNLNTINAIFSVGTVTVTASSAMPTPTPTPKPQVKNVNVVIGSAQGSAGQTIAVPVNFQGVSAEGINNCDFKISYDSNVFETASVDPGSIVNPTLDFSAYTGNPGYILLLYVDSTQGSNPITSDGVFANINLKVKAGAAAGNYQIIISSIGEFSDKNLETINTVSNVGTFTVKKSDLPVPTAVPTLKPQSINVEIGSVQGLTGQTVTVPVGFQGVPLQGINNSDFKLSYDSNVFEVVSIDAGSIIVNPTNNFKANVETAGIITFLFNDSSQGSNPITTSGIFANVNFKIKADASAGNHQIKLSYVGSFADSNLMNVNAVFNIGTVKVTLPVVTSTPTPTSTVTPTSTATPTATPTPTLNKQGMNVVIGSAKGYSGQTVIVPVNFQGVPSQGINNCDFKLSYDTNMIEIVSIDPGSIIVNPAGNFTVSTITPGTISFIFNDGTQGSSPIKANGLFAKINIKLKSTASGSYQIKLESAGSFDDNNLMSINTAFNSGTVENTGLSVSSTPTPIPTPTVKPQSMSVKVGSVQGIAGQTVTVPVSFQGVPSNGINNCDFRLSYDKNIFDVVDIAAGDIVTNPAGNFSTNTINPGDVLFMFSDSTQGLSSITADGLFANVRLKIKSGIAVGNYEIKLSDIGSFADTKLINVNVTFAAGIVVVQSAPSYDFSIDIGSVKGSSGQTIVVPISFKNIPAKGINSCDFKISYDTNIFEIVSVDAGSIVKNPVVNFGSYQGVNGYVSFLYNDATQGSNSITTDGVFANISLKIKTGVTPGSYNIQINKLGGFADKDLGDLKVTSSNGQTTIE